MEMLVQKTIIEKIFRSFTLPVIFRPCNLLNHFIFFNPNDLEKNIDYKNNFSLFFSKQNLWSVTNIFFYLPDIFFLAVVVVARQ